MSRRLQNHTGTGGNTCMARNSIELMGTPDGLFYWIPGEMVVVVRLHRHPAVETQNALIEQIRGQLNALLARYGMVLEPYGTIGRWGDIPGATAMRRSFIFGLHRQQPLLAIFFQVRQASLVAQDPMPMALSYIQTHLEQLAQAGLFIVSAMPNWLVAAAPLLYGSGGPAAPPMPAPEPDPSALSGTPQGWRVAFADPGLPLDPNGAEDVVVAVLDTAHHPDRIRAAVTRPELQYIDHVDMPPDERQITTGRLQDVQFEGSIQSPGTVGRFFISGSNVVCPRKHRRQRAPREIIGAQIASGELHVKGADRLVLVLVAWKPANGIGLHLYERSVAQVHHRNPRPAAAFEHLSGKKCASRTLAGWLYFF